MADTKGGFPFWEVRFGERGEVVDGADLLIGEIAAKNLTDLLCRKPVNRRPSRVVS
jgi:hypothetical protein